MQDALRNNSDDNGPEIRRLESLGSCLHSASVSETALFACDVVVTIVLVRVVHSFSQIYALVLTFLASELSLDGRHWQENPHRPPQFPPVTGSWRASPAA